MIARNSQDKCDHDRRWSTESQKDLAEAVGSNPRTIAQWVRAGLPRWSAGGNRYRYCIPCTVHWLGSRGTLDVTCSLQAEDDLLLNGGGNSPNLERFRAARADEAEFRVAELRKQLSPRDVIRHGLGMCASVWRKCGERLGKRFGPEAAITVNDAIEECRRVIRNEFGNDQSAELSQAECTE